MKNLFLVLRLYNLKHSDSARLLPDFQLWTLTPMQQKLSAFTHTLSDSLIALKTPIILAMYKTHAEVRRTKGRSGQRGWNWELVRSAHRLASRRRRRARTGRRAPSCCSHRPAGDAYTQRIRGEHCTISVHLQYCTIRIEHGISAHESANSLLADVEAHIEMWAQSGTHNKAQDEKGRQHCPFTPVPRRRERPLNRYLWALR